MRKKQSKEVELILARLDRLESIVLDRPINAVPFKATPVTETVDSEAHHG